MAALIARTLLLYGLPIIYEILYKWLLAKFGPAVMSLASTNIVSLAKWRKEKGMSAEEAERQNVVAIQEATRQSPPISKSDAKLINLACYAKYVKENEPDKFQEWVDRASKWFATRQKRDEVSFSIMGLYIDPPDKKKGGEAP